jgi:hypothetical protein
LQNVVFGLASEMLLSSFSFAFQPIRAGDLSGHGQAPFSTDAFDFGVSSSPLLFADAMSIPQGL